MKVFILGILVLLSGALVIELGLRLLFGFGNPPLYMADDDIGYLLAPNQRVRRFGNLININQYSMRSDVVASPRPIDTLRVFLIGDSIVNGNWWTDQADILSALIQKSLSTVLTEPEVLNASANSWGPRNELAYLQRFGTFEAQIVLLVINTDDLFGTQPSPLQVGKDRSYPAHKPSLAILEIANRLQKQAPIPGLKDSQNEPGDRVGKNLTAIAEMRQYVTNSNGQFLVAMTPLKREVINGPKDYELVARQRIDALIDQHNIPYIDFLTSFQAKSFPENLYRDHIHLSPEGNTLVTQALSHLILDALKSPD